MHILVTGGAGYLGPIICEHNVGLDQANLSKEELAQKTLQYVPGFVIQASPIRSDPDKRNSIVSNDRLARAAFSARRTLDDGIIELLKGYAALPRPSFANVEPCFPYFLHHGNDAQPPL